MLNHYNCCLLFKTADQQLRSTVSLSRYTGVKKFSLSVHTYITHLWFLTNSSISIRNLTTVPWVQMVSTSVYSSAESVLPPDGFFLCAIKLTLAQIILTSNNSLQIFWGNFLSDPPWVSACILLLRYISGIFWLWDSSFSVYHLDRVAKGCLLCHVALVKCCLYY